MKEIIPVFERNPGIVSSDQPDGTQSRHRRIGSKYEPATRAEYRLAKLPGLAAEDPATHGRLGVRATANVPTNVEHPGKPPEVAMISVSHCHIPQFSPFFRDGDTVTTSSNLHSFISTVRYIA